MMWQDRVRLLEQTTLFHGLTERQLRAMALELSEVSFAQGQTIFSKGVEGEALYIIDTGRVKISLYAPDGNELIVNIYSGGELFGEMTLFDGLPRSATATAMSEVSALRLSRASYNALLESLPGLAANIIAILSRRLRYTTTQLELVGLLDAYERVSLKLKQLFDEAPASPTIGPVTLNLSQHELAAMVGLTRVWINKVLKYLAEQGVIQVKRGQLVILLPNQL